MNRGEVCERIAFSFIKNSERVFILNVSTRYNYTTDPM